MKSETNSNYQNLNDQNKNVSSKWFVAFVLNFERYNFEFCICLKQRDFDIRISDLLALSNRYSCLSLYAMNRRKKVRNRISGKRSKKLQEIGRGI